MQSTATLVILFQSLTEQAKSTKLYLKQYVFLSTPLNPHGYSMLECFHDTFEP